MEIGSISDDRVLQLYAKDPAFGLYLMRLVVQRMLVGERRRPASDRVYGPWGSGESGRRT